MVYECYCTTSFPSNIFSSAACINAIRSREPHNFSPKTNVGAPFDVSVSRGANQGRNYPQYADSHHRKLVKVLDKNGRNIVLQFRSEFWIVLAYFGDLAQAIHCTLTVQPIGQSFTTSLDPKTLHRKNSARCKPCRHQSR
jgi:hypothetical protein